MKITLAYPFDGHAHDETVDLPEEVARQLLADGIARRPDVTTKHTDSTPKQIRRSGGNTEGNTQ